MALTLSQSYTAICGGNTSSFLASGNVGAVTYSVKAGGAGGSINSSTGLYTAPSVASSSPNDAYDTIIATDSANNTATSQILIGTPLILFLDVLQNQLGLDNNHCYLWDQKLFQPQDYGLYIAISVMSCKPFGNTVEYNGSGSGLSVTQFVNMMATLDVDIISRGPAARDQKELVIAALVSVYAQQQQEKNGFYIGKLPWGSQFINLSNIDGAAIPYRYKISIALQYFVNIVQSVPYLSTFSQPQVTTNP